VGSKTLLGFAKRHRLALMSSGFAVPKTPRTSRADQVGYFHLAVRRAGEGVRNLVMSDRSGEAYEAARIDTSLIGELTEFRQADRIVFLLDAPKLTSLETRATYSRQFKQMIHALRDNGALSQASELEVLATKMDIIEASAKSGELKAFLTQFEEAVVQDLRQKGLETSSYRICAMPKAKRDVGFLGLSELVARWTAPPAPLDLPMPRADGPAREIDRLVGRWELEAGQ
jgi:hypothetical protein